LKTDRKIPALILSPGEGEKDRRVPAKSPLSEKGRKQEGEKKAREENKKRLLYFFTR